VELYVIMSWCLVKDGRTSPFIKTGIDYLHTETSQFSHRVRVFLDRKFPDHWTNSLDSRSPDLTPLNFFLLGVWKRAKFD